MLGHGTHIAGIIGADPPKNPYNISGVAYSASLSSYRVFGCTGGTSDDLIVEALLRAAQDGQDIITLSLGGVNGWTEGTASVVASRIAQSGKVVTISAGNDGESGSWYTSGPANGIDVISVASFDNTVVPAQFVTVQGPGVNHDPITYYSLTPFPVTEPLPLYATSNNTSIEDDACNPLPDDTPDLSRFLVIEKLKNIHAKGGNTTFIYDNGKGFATVSTPTNYTTSLIQAADGEFLVKQFAAGVPVTVSFPQTGGAMVHNPDGGLISYYSSYGPTNDMFFKPAIAAPGGNIVSTLPVPLGSYGLESGTSMAAPFVAGSAALLLQAKGKSPDFVRTIRTLLETTAIPVPANHTKNSDSLLQTLTQQGAGLINVYNAVHTTTLVSPGELLLNDTTHFDGVEEFTVQNTANSEKTFHLSHVPAGTAITIQPGTIFPAKGPVPLTNAFATVAQATRDPTTFPVFSGFIQIASSDAEEPLVHVSYLGLAAALKDKRVIDDTDTALGIRLPAIVNSTGDPQEGLTNYTFSNATRNFPSPVFRLIFGTPRLRLDLVDSDVNVQAFVNGSGLVGNERGDSEWGKPADAPVNAIGSLFEIDYLGRNNDDPKDNIAYNLAINSPTFVNGSTIPNGKYRILMRALRVTGDVGNEGDYESWLSPVFGVFIP
ncbi:hypothetical protein PM082_000736 [Marasmius tenuissimus]|nr:hypothetical protein PM082_000736 [Marasmius tenuissimus]